jgi:formylglycine-generating enzyme required for sulfatase activity
MGSVDWHADERPIHKAIISKPLYFGAFPITQAQYLAVMKNNPSHFQDDNLDLPVEQVSWHDTQLFIDQLNALKNGNHYRLPTEAEWEFAARAGSSGDYAGDLPEMAWYERNAGGTTHPVGTKAPNAWGLYDMHGNVWEWCQDWYDEHYYANSPLRDPLGPSSGQSRILRGGSWYCFDNFCRSSNRGRYAPEGRLNSHGFRLVMVSSGL